MRRALQKYIEDPLSEALIQGTLPRPAELEVYLGDTGIYCRQVGDMEGQPVAAGDVESTPGSGSRTCHSAVHVYLRSAIRSTCASSLRTSNSKDRILN